MASFRHNKKRNSGMVFEFLVRRLSKTMIERDEKEYRKALEITRKYFGDGAPLAEEKELFDVLRSSRDVTEGAARRIINEVSKAAQKLDRKKLEIKKSNLIKDINYSFGKEFFSEHRIPDYRILASIQMVIDSAQGSHVLTETVQKIQLEEVLVNYMTTSGQASMVPQKEPIDNVVMVMASKRFNEKYSTSLSKPQRTLLEKYIRSLATGDEFQLFQHVVTEAQRIGGILDRASTLAEVRKDPEMKARLAEAQGKFKSLTEPSVSVSETLIEEIMLYQKLCEEVESE